MILFLLHCVYMVLHYSDAVKYTMLHNALHMCPVV
jgi:hypothetical protein